MKNIKDLGGDAEPLKELPMTPIKQTYTFRLNTSEFKNFAKFFGIYRLDKPLIHKGKK